MLTRSNGHRRTGCVFAIYLSAHVETELLPFWPLFLLSQQLKQAARTSGWVLPRPTQRPCYGHGSELHPWVTF